MDRKELIKKYIKFFKSKNHAEIRNSPLIPENDPTVLFTTAGMHPLVPFLLGEKHPQGKRLVNVQRCIRTSDIEEVGNTTHHTFFEMLGNWSLGDYFKKEAIEMSFEFLTKILRIPKERLAVSVFEGDENAPKDKESVEIWNSLGISKERIALLSKKDNWWGPAGESGPCGPDTEMFYWKLNSKPAPKIFDSKDSGWVEIWNDVLMEYNKDKNGNYKEAKQKNIDTGMGVERIVAVLDGFEDNYLASMWKPIIEEIEQLSGKEYKDYGKEMRIIADHIKAAVFIINDGVVPGSSEQGYILRRLIRRAIRYGWEIGLRDFTCKVAKIIFDIYDDYFPKNDKKVWFVNRDTRTYILDEMDREEMKFLYTVEKGLKLLRNMTTHEKKIDGRLAFFLFQSHGFPIEMTVEILKEHRVKMDYKKFQKEFQKELAKHQKLSRTASAGKFKSGLADNSDATKKLHTACHILNQALREVLGDKNIFQKGSNITPERLRFDFNFDRKLTSEEKRAIEDLVNKKIRENISVTMKEMTVDEAKSAGAHGVFDSKYGDRVKVYLIGDFSKEICAGPHVENTSELGIFKIKKESSSSAGVRRIKAVLE